MRKEINTRSGEASGRVVVQEFCLINLKRSDLEFKE